MAFRPAADRTIAAIVTPVQLLMSVTVPFFGVLLAADLRRTHRTRVAPMLLAALTLAVLVAIFGLLVSVLPTAAAPSEAPEGRWPHVGTIVLGSVLVQIVAQLVGTGLGLLLRSVILACLATVVIPLGTVVSAGHRSRRSVRAQALADSLSVGPASVVAAR